MAKYKIFFRASVRKDFRTVPKKDVTRILRKIESLITEPRPSGCENLTNQEWYRVRQGHYRILYSIQDNENAIWIVKVSHRKDIYRQR